MNEIAIRRVNLGILGSLLLLSVASWAVLLWRQDGIGATGMSMSAMGEDVAMLDGGSRSDVLTMGMAMPLFMVMWTLMMVAMMFPTAAPMVLTFNRIAQQRKSAGQAFVPTWFFVASYLAVWAVFGIVAYAIAVGVDVGAEKVMFLRDHGAQIGGGVLAAAGLYQLSPLKTACLAKCRTPLHFLMTSWKDGYLGALQMGTLHGSFCLGCCWLLFVILFPLGIMNVAAMGLVTMLIYAEKSIRHGQWIGRAVGVGLVAFGLAVSIAPQLLPTTL